MDRTELAATLHGLAKGALSDAATRAVNAGDVVVAPLPVRTVVDVDRRRRLGRHRPTVATVQTTGVNAWRLDDTTAVALARGGLLLRDSDGVYRVTSAAELAAARDERTLSGYLADARALISSVAGDDPDR